MPKYVIDDKVYDTEKAEVICKNAALSIFGGYSIILGRNITQTKSGTIYRTKKGAYFFECGAEGNAYTITEEQVKHYLKYHNYEKYAELCGRYRKEHREGEEVCKVCAQQRLYPGYAAFNVSVPG